MALLTEGCILPQDEVVLPELPPTKNSPLRIVKAIEPQDSITKIRAGLGMPGCENLPLPFSVAVADSDLGDTISHTWYLDRGLEYEPKTITANSVDPGQEIRTVTSPGELTTHLQKRADDKRHLVEVQLSDGQLGEYGQVKPAEGRDTAYLATYAWYVVVEACK
jgi:hypothetical protein